MNERIKESLKHLSEKQIERQKNLLMERVKKLDQSGILDDYEVIYEYGNVNLARLFKDPQTSEINHLFLEALDSAGPSSKAALIFSRPYDNIYIATIVYVDVELGDLKSGFLQYKLDAGWVVVTTLEGYLNAVVQTDNI